MKDILKGFFEKTGPTPTVEKVGNQVANSRRRRLTPAERKAQILSAASELVQHGEIKDVTMKAVAEKAGISTALVYNYFPNRSELLRRLLIFELNKVDLFLEEASASAKTFEAFVRRTTNAELQSRMKQYIVIQKITDEAKFDSFITETYERRHQIHMDYLSKRMGQATGLSTDLTLMATQLNYGIIRAATPLINQPSTDLQYLEDVIVDMVMANVSALAVKYGTGPLRNF